MSFDVLFVASDSVLGSFSRPESYAYMQGKYGLPERDVLRLLAGAAPIWQEKGFDMSFMAAENWCRNGRSFSLSEEDANQYLNKLTSDSLTKFGNGIYVTDHLVKKGLSVELVNDLSSEWETFLEHLAKGPRIIAISSTFICSREGGEKIAQRIKKVAPDIPVVIGGPLVHYSHKILQEAPQHFDHPHGLTYFFGHEPPDPAIDLAIIEARGEATLAEMALRIRDGRSWKDLPNVAYPQDGRWHFNAMMPEQVGVDDEGVQWDSLDAKFLGREVAVRGSRGCPLRCKFCSFVVIHPDFSVKGVDVLRQELRGIAQRSDIIKHVSFVDDNLFLTRKSVNEYCRMMAEEKFPFTWSAFMRIDSITEQNIKWIKESGCVFLMLGIESGDQAILRNMRKGQRPEKVLRAMDHLTDHGISSLSTMLVGFPGETADSVDRTIQLLNSYPDRGDAVHWYKVWVHMVTPLTPVDKERETWDLDGILLDWKHQTMNVAEAFHHRDRMLREVRKGGAYIGPYAYDSMNSFAKRGDRGFRAMRDFYKLRHRIACLDHWQLQQLDGATREQTLAEIERLVLEHSEVRGAV